MKSTFVKTKDGTFEINPYGYVRKVADEPEPSKPRNSEYRRIFLARQKEKQQAQD